MTKRNNLNTRKTSAKLKVLEELEAGRLTAAQAKRALKAIDGTPRRGRPRGVPKRQVSGLIPVDLGQWVDDYRKRTGATVSSILEQALIKFKTDVVTWSGR